MAFIPIIKYDIVCASKMHHKHFSLSPPKITFSVNKNVPNHSHRTLKDSDFTYRGPLKEIFF